LFQLFISHQEYYVFGAWLETANFFCWFFSVNTHNFYFKSCQNEHNIKFFNVFHNINSEYFLLFVVFYCLNTNFWIVWIKGMKIIHYSMNLALNDHVLKKQKLINRSWSKEYLYFLLPNLFQVEKLHRKINYKLGRSMADRLFV
jgi:hypothetical protein